MRLVLILRGVSGSGKSTEAARWLGRALSPVIVSADSHMGLDFDWGRLAEVHERCFVDFVDALNRGHDLVVIDNTNTRLSEVERYVREARASNYEVLVLQIHEDPKVAARRSKHRPPLHTIEKQARRLWCERIPTNWGVDVWNRGVPWRPPSVQAPQKVDPRPNRRRPQRVQEPRRFKTPDPTVEYRRSVPVKTSSES